MTLGYEVIDADAHVLETDETWDFLEPAERKFRPLRVGSQADNSHEYWIVDGHVAGPPLSTHSDAYEDALAEKSARNMKTPATARKMSDVPLRLRHMTELGIDTQVLHNSLWISHVTDRPDVQVALCRSWNRWLADIWRQGAGRLRWTCVVPTMSIPDAVEEIAFCKANGAVGVCLQPYERELMMLDPAMYPIFQAASDHDLAIIVHIANGDPVFESTLRGRYQGLPGSMPFILPTVAVCYGLMVSDVTTTFPNLRWGIIEAASGWVPWLVQHVGRRSHRSFNADENPFREKSIYVTTQVDDDHDYVMRWIGADHLVIGTDYGHTDTSSEVDAITQFRDGELDAIRKQKVLSDNPAALYGIKIASSTSRT